MHCVFQSRWPYTYNPSLCLEPFKVKFKNEYDKYVNYSVDHSMWASMLSGTRPLRIILFLGNTFADTVWKSCQTNKLSIKWVVGSSSVRKTFHVQFQWHRNYKNNRARNLKILTKINDIVQRKLDNVFKN